MSNEDRDPAWLAASRLRNKARKQALNLLAKEHRKDYLRLLDARWKALRAEEASGE